MSGSKASSSASNGKLEESKPSTSTFGKIFRIKNSGLGGSSIAPAAAPSMASTSAAAKSSSKESLAARSDGGRFMQDSMAPVSTGEGTSSFREPPHIPLPHAKSDLQLPVGSRLGGTLNLGHLGASTNGVSSGLHDQQGPESRIHYRLDEVIQERNNYQELLRDAVARIFELETRLRAEEAHPEVELLQQKAVEIHRKSKATIAAMTGDIADLKLMYRTEKNAKENLRGQLVAVQKELELAKTTLKVQENALKDSETVVKKLNDESFSLQQALASTQATLSGLKQERSEKMKDSQASTERNLILASKIEELERRNAETMAKLEEAVEFGERAVKERDQLALRFRDSNEEVNELRDAERKTYTELVDRSRRDISIVKKNNEELISQLKEDIRTLETRLTEKDIELSRADRELKTARMHIERMDRDTIAAQKELPSLDDIRRRLAAAEQDRDRLALMVEQTQNSLKQKLEEIGLYETKFERNMRDQSERLKETLEQCESLNNERMAMAEEIQRLQIELDGKERSLQTLNREIQSEITVMKEKTKLAAEERVAREAAMEEAQRQSVMELQEVNLLLRQQVSHWQAEFNNLQNANEFRIRDLKERLMKTRSKEHELEMELRRQTILNSDMTKRMDEIKNSLFSITALS